MSKIAIIGREKEMCTHILDELRATYQDYEIRAIPLIKSEGIPFELPHSTRKQMFLFTSPRAVEHFLERHNIPEGSEVATLGHRTTRTLCNHGIEPNMTGRFKDAVGMPPELLNYMRYTASNYQIVLPTYGNGVHHYGDSLREQSIDFTTLQVYKVSPHPKLSENLAKIEDKPKWVLFFSPVSVQAWVGATDWRPTAISVDRATSCELRNQGFNNIFESSSPHHFDLLNTIIKHNPLFKVD